MRQNPVVGPMNSFVEPSGQIWNLEVVHENEWKHGRQTDRKDPNGPIVKFYDGDYAGTKGFGPLGQQASSYYVSTLLGEDDIHPHDRTGLSLNLHGDVPKWTVSGPVMDQVRAWLRAFCRPRQANPEETPHFSTLKEKIRWEKQRRESEHRTWKELIEEAHRLAMLAGEIATPDIMVVTTAGGMPIEEVTEGPCGFAWVSFYPAKGGASRRFANWVTGKTDSTYPPPIRAEFSSYGGGVRIWVHAFNQSMQRKERYAGNMAAYLQQMFPDAKAYANSRMD